MNIQQRFRRIKKLFFPRFDRDNRWRAKSSSKRNVHGYCDSEHRVIEIAHNFSDDPDELDLLLIHEICHAFASSHGKMWQDRMQKAAQRADEIERHELAKLLRDEILAYQRSPSLSVWRKQFYGQIDDVVLECPTITLPQLISCLANDFGMLESEVCKLYPRTEAAFQKARRYAAKLLAHDERLRRAIATAGTRPRASDR